MQKNLLTDRLELTELQLHEAAFMLELLNTPGWIKFIGDRKVRTIEDATAYVKKIMANPAVHYWIVKLPHNQTSIGIVSLIKREDMEHHDIGFSFLPLYSKQGFAYEATSAVLKSLRSDASHTKILAVTINGNTNSVRLLEKLGLRLDKAFKKEGEDLLLYAIDI